jgi:hypothetical protein
VNVDGVTVYDTRAYDSADKAKQAVARRAVEHVRNKKEVPPGPPNKACDRINAVANKTLLPGQRAQKPKLEDVMKPEKRVPEKPMAGKSPKVRSANEFETDKQLVARVQAQFGHLAGPSDVIMNDPVASRAFLEGFAFGCKVRVSTLQENGPEANDARNRAYRERSRARSSRGRSPRDHLARDSPSKGHGPQGRRPAQGRPVQDGSPRARRSRHLSRDRDRRTRTRSPVRTQRHSTAA